MPTVPIRGYHNPMNFESLSRIRVRYAETDAMGIVHHAVYPVWMELGRSDLLREIGTPYPEWEAAGVMMSVSELNLKYRAPARYDEEVEVRTRIKGVNRRQIIFEYTITRDGKRLVEGQSVHLAMGPDGRARTIPDELLNLLS